MEGLSQTNNTFFRESLRPLKPTAQQLRDKRYHPTVEAVYLRRSALGGDNFPVLPSEGRIQIPVIDGRPGDPNRHHSRPLQEEVHTDEYEEFKEYGNEFLELFQRIQAIREKSQLYPIWAADDAPIPQSLSRKFAELNQQLFALKKCFVSPEEIMLDNTAAMIQRVWRKFSKRQRLKKALESVRNYKLAALAPTHRALGSWMAQMEYADSRAVQFHFRNVIKLAKVSSRYWQKWSERESLVTNRNEIKASEFLTGLNSRRFRSVVREWKNVAMGDRSRKAMQLWRSSMVPVMKKELEAHNLPVPSEYQELASSYIYAKSSRSFIFEFFLSWHARCHSKSLRETVGERNAMIFHKKRLIKLFFTSWYKGYSKTKKFFDNPDKWPVYISLIRRQHQARLKQAGELVERWRNWAHNCVILRKRTQTHQRKLKTLTFRGWRDTTVKHLDMRMEAVNRWKRCVQDPLEVSFRGWQLYSLKRKTKRQMMEQLLVSSLQWRTRSSVEKCFWKWRTRQTQMIAERSSMALIQKKRDFETARRHTVALGEKYKREKDRVTDLETKLGDVTSQFLAAEDQAAALEDTSTTWKVALHALKMELLRLGLIVSRCDSNDRRRRYSDEDRADIILRDDRYGQRTESQLSKMKVSDLVVSKWKRRDSDPELFDGVPLVDMKPPLDDNILQLLSTERD